jgi:hypothetical protein
MDAGSGKVIRTPRDMGYSEGNENITSPIDHCSMNLYIPYIQVKMFITFAKILPVATLLI